ncbi:EmrB/QacA subfamily drug resistance transporter [Streptomyces sp. 1114.5]|uniref:MFS transporter n=1 Tax=Streptomyces sp. 1114.5 TaxID=1938830 RepID=UPI000EB29FF4|nr:MFS transporter [Streptomyces sp. 1114.5]RKT09255.1 EmrB/QacA subfamily drug resistance transporter [Streptomyces sp. 1114.5]
MRKPPPGAVLAVLAAGQFTVMLATSIVNVALPQIRDGVGLSDAATTWVVNAYGLAFGALLPAGGRAADLLGRRRVLLVGLGAFGAASATAALAASPGVLIAARAAQGVGAAAIAPAALALAMDLHPPGPGRTRALAVWGAVSGAGGAAGVVLGGVLTRAWGWPWIFHAVTIGTFAVLVATLTFVPSTPPADRAGFDLAGTAASAMSVTALVWGLTTARRDGWTDIRVLAAFGAATALALVFLRIERRAAAPLVPPRLFAGGRVAAGNLLMGLFGSTWIALFYFLPLYQQQVLGEDPLTTGLGQLPLAGANMAGAALAPALARRVGTRAALVGALLAEAAGMLWLSRISADGGFPTDVLGPSLLVGVGLSIAFVQLTALSVEGVTGADAGLAGGLVNTTRQVGGAVGLAVLATVAGTVTAHAGGHRPDPEALTSGYRSAFAASAAVLAATALLAARLTRRTPTGPTDFTDPTDAPNPAARPTVHGPH